MYPLKFDPFLRTMVWGGEKIARYKGIETDDKHVGESWEVSAVEGHESMVANGSLKGKSITDLVRKYKGQLVGEHVYARCGDEFPLLIKFIDALSDLSIQVHPDDAMAMRRHGQQNGKTEMWYVVAADPGACLYSGLTQEITPEEYEQRVADGTITDVLARHEVHPGDVFFLPAGRIHAICSGCFIAEIQQTSDLTYRIYDYGRMGLDGKPRQLHTELAKEAIDYKVYPDYRTAYTSVPDAENELISCKYFTTSLYELSHAVTKDLSGVDSFLVVMCLSGKGTLTDAEPVFDEQGRRGPTKGHVIDLHQGETVLIPASSVGVTFTPAEGGMKLLTSYIR
jgi:mannose-6-phosphate isomerase